MLETSAKSEEAASTMDCNRDKRGVGIQPACSAWRRAQSSRCALAPGVRLVAPTPTLPTTPTKPLPTTIHSPTNVTTTTATSNDLGEALLLLAKILPTTSAPTCRQRHQSQFPAHGHWMLFVAMGCMVACQLAFTMDFSERLQQLIGGILLAASAGTLYLLLCFLLYACDATLPFGVLLLQRSNPFWWQRDRLRFFLEVCFWMASVWYSYTTFHSELLSVCGGAVTALALAVISDVVAAYARVLEARRYAKTARTRESVAWLKVLLSYICVGYVLTRSWRNLQGFLSGELADFQSIDDLVMAYSLITLVGVSLIVASELLLLYEPTRAAGIILQSRIVDARPNWEQHTWRSLAEATAVCGSTVLAYHINYDMMLALQIGTLTGVAMILAGETISSNVLLFSSRNDELPADHWVKLLPLGVMMVYFLYRVGVAAIELVVQRSYFGLGLVWFISLCAVSLTVVAFHDSADVLNKIASFGRQFGGSLCIVGMAIVATVMCDGWPAVVFSTYLSWFCSSLSRECWDDIEAKEKRKAATACASPVATAAATASTNESTATLSTVPDSDPKEEPGNAVLRLDNVMGFVRVNYSNLYKRLKWTFIAIVLLSIVDFHSTVFMLLKDSSYQVSLSQFSAGNVFVSTGVGYLTSTINHELRPEVLAQTGFRHFKNKWLLFPLHAFVEATVFLGVFIGTFAATSTMFSSLTLASLSGIVISVGGQWVRSRLHLTVGNRARMQLTATCAMVFCVFLFAWISFICLFSIYHYIDSIEAAFCLASLAGVLFLASSELFLLWEPTREIGHILQSRVTNAKENWHNEPLRSFLELFTWFAVISGSFALYNDLLLALQLGTFSGIAVTLSGEYYRRKRQEFIQWENDDEGVPAEATNKSNPSAATSAKSERPRVLPVMLLFAYIGSGTFQWIFENIRSLEVTVLLATFAGFAFLCVADLLVQYKPTRWAGIILQDRFLRAKDNWNENPVRSFVELGCFLGVIYGSYAIYGDLVVATQVGTVSGMLVTLIGEQVRTHARALPHIADLDDTTTDTSENKVQVLPLPVMSLLGLVGAIAFNIIYTHLRSIEVAFVLATASGVAFALLADVFVIWQPTRKAGLTLQDRVLYVRYNWKIHPLRSWLEIMSCATAWYVSYEFIWPNDLLVAVQVGTVTGMMTCICDELVVEYLRKFEQKILQGGRASGARTNAQTDSSFMALPYDLQFQIAHFLSPEDLLVARATCHKVNGMLRAESARYWLYSSIRRKFGGGRRRRSGDRIDERMRGQARSLIYEAIQLIIPKIFSPRDPTDVLTSGICVSRALKWVYLNADWIRAQDLDALPEDHASEMIRFAPGDKAFEVFRHLPDKSYLGIATEREDDLSIKHIDVPVAVYTKIQTDPFSFVAAETLSEVDAFSNWHVAVVTFFAMTLIFIGQLSSDVLRHHVLPESFWWPG